MLPIFQKPETIYDAYSLFCSHLKADESSESTDPTSGLRTALIRYTLPKLGLPSPTRNKLTQNEVNAGLEFMKTIPISEIEHLLGYQQEVFDSLGGVSSSRTYRLHLTKMVTWCLNQTWGQVLSNPKAEVRCPKIRVKSGRVGDKVRVTDKKLTSASPGYAYAIKPSETSSELQQQFEKLFTFQTAVTVRKRQDKPLRPRSAEGHVKTAKRLLGWLYRYKNVPKEELCLKKLVCSSGLTPDGQRDEAIIDEIMDLMDEHLQWLRDEREASPNTELKSVEGFVAIAKFLYHKESKCQSRYQTTNEQVSYRDIPIIEELRALEREVMARVNTTPRRSDESKKWLDWPVFKACVQRLIEECAPKAQCGKPRTQRTLAQCHQVALIFLLLSVFPDRARTICELQIGKTLVDRDGKWFIEQTANDFKTGDSYCKNGQKRIVELPASIYPLLEDWLYKWRSVFHPNHSFVFTQLNGKQLTNSSLYNYVRKRVWRLAGKAFTPHMVRDSVVTHLSLSGATDEVMRALAELMGHSLEMQRKIYDRRTPQQRVAPALEALQSERPGILPPPP